jgi:putative sterol carrier protein
MSGNAQIKTWFTRQLPALLISKFDDFLAVQGDISFQIGDEAYTLTFGDLDEPVKVGATPKAALRLKFTPHAFLSFVDGSLDPVAAIGKGDIKASGDIELLATLATLMMPLQRDLGWDAG